jgi:hypothetical protein
MARSLTWLLLCCAPLAQAQTVFKWVDADGTHYTNSPETIPKGATVTATDGEPISNVGKPAPPPDEKRPEAKKPEPVLASAADPAVPTSAEQYWRGQFKAAREKIAATQDEIAIYRRKVEDPTGLPISGRYTCFHAQPYHYGPVYGPGYVNTQQSGCIQTPDHEYERAKEKLERNKKLLERAREELADLERRASFEAVPLQWRR